MVVLALPVSVVSVDADEAEDEVIDLQLIMSGGSEKYKLAALTRVLNSSDIDSKMDPGEKSMKGLACKNGRSCERLYNAAYGPLKCTTAAEMKVELFALTGQAIVIPPNIWRRYCLAFSQIEAERTPPDYEAWVARIQCWIPFDDSALGTETNQSIDDPFFVQFMTHVDQEKLEYQVSIPKPKKRAEQRAWQRRQSYWIDLKAPDCQFIFNRRACHNI